MTKDFSSSQLEWQWQKFEALSASELYAILKIRQSAFIVEQDCPYFDIDGQDQFFLHLTAHLEEKLVAYLRLLPPQELKGPVYFGRVVVDKKYRGFGIAKDLIQKALDYIHNHYPESMVIISAQSYLEKFYNMFGFVKVGAPYDEDGIEHIAMRRSAPN